MVRSFTGYRVKDRIVTIETENKKIKEEYSKDILQLKKRLEHLESKYSSIVDEKVSNMDIDTSVNVKRECETYDEVKTPTLVKSQA